MPLHIDTPLLQSLPLGQLTGRTVWLKMDALQPAGSFKTRGIGAAAAEYARRGKTRLVSSSGGNAGLAAAYAGRQLGLPVTVVVPETATARARALLEAEGATVVVHGAAWAEANERALSLLDDATAFLHPFDDPLVWSGHASLIEEVVRTGASFDGVVLSVGGGGLLAGIAEGLDGAGLGHLPIVAAETAGADCLARSVAAGHNVTLPKITSVATSLGANRLAEGAWVVARQARVRSAVVSDREAVDACLGFLDDHRVLVEPACGAALAVLYAERHRGVLQGMEAPLVVVCGGATATAGKLAEWQAAA